MLPTKEEGGLDETDFLFVTAGGTVGGAGWVVGVFEWVDGCW